MLKSFFFFVFLLNIWTCTALASEVRILKSASELDYPPFAVVLEDGTADGFSVELLKAVTQAVGLRVDFSVGPWHEIKQKLIDGHLDVLPLVSYSAQRDRNLDFSASYMRLGGTVFVRDNDSSIRSEADLKHKEVLVMRNDNAHEYALENDLSDYLVLTDTYEEALMRLSSGRHDAVLMLHLVGLQLLKTHHIHNIVSIHSFQETNLKPAAGPLSGYEQKFCFAVQEGNKDLLGSLNEGLAIVIANGIYNALYDKWFGPVLPQPKISWIQISKYLFFILFPVLLLVAGIGIWYLKKEVAHKTRHLEKEVQDRKQAEITLAASENKFRTLFNVAAIPMCYAGGDGRILDFNPKFSQTFGYTMEDIPTLDQWFARAYPDPEYRQWVMNTWQAEVQKAQEDRSDITPIEYQVTCKDGETRSVIISGTVFEDQFLATFVDLTNLKQVEERFERFFAMISDIFCIADINGYFRLINPAASKILGYSREELLGKPFMEFVHPDDRETTMAIIQEKLEQGATVFNFLNRYICRDGSVKWLEWTSHPVPDQGITFAVARDCTERLYMEAALKKTLTDLERSNDELQQFAYVASHDLQEPLRATVGFLQLLQIRYKDQLDEKGHHYIERAVTAGYRMQGLINDLLALSRVNAQNTVLKETRLTDLLTETLENLHAAISEKNARISYPDLPLLRADKTQIRELFQNLISNALKYNDSPAPVIEIGYETDDHEYCFYFKDNGIGIPEEFRDKIFMIFQRLHTRKTYSGSGIGLALCKKIVERHGGKIWVSSEPGNGSVFYFTLSRKLL